MKRFTLFLLCIPVFFAGAQELSKPKLVVGIVIDQMRWDFLYRYQDRYGKDGFNRILREGFSCENSYINYTPTYTGAGHASVYTGTVPALNGIMGNNWYDRSLNRNVYCVEDPLVQTVGGSSTAGQMSPRNMWSTTITDELRLATNFRNKTIAIALKDRGSILPGGHTANGAYWFDNNTGGFITSSFYMDALPAWVNRFNEKKLPDSYMARNWNTLYPVASYVQSTKDSNRYEAPLGGGGSTFPHLTKDVKNPYEVFRFTPGGNSYTFDMALAAIEGESLGRRGFTDFLALSLSSPDYAGHSFAPNSIEMEDMYLRLDRDMANFLKQLDLKIGKGQYVLFLTADHGAAHNPYFMADNKIPAGTFEEGKIKKELTELVEKEYGAKGIIEGWINYQIYLNRQLMEDQKLDRKKIISSITNYLLQQPAISNVADLQELSNATIQAKLKSMMANGYNQKLSGDIQYAFRPQYFETWRKGTTHGSWNPYDARIPILWMGWKIKPGKTNREIYMEDIAPTLSALLQIQVPNASVGNVITEITGVK
jgi:predicted AlkP superfamily pyrophosphatase or phosphodiesterase